MTVDAAAERLRDEVEVQGAIATVLEFACGWSRVPAGHRRLVRRLLPGRPTVKELVEGVLAALGPSPDEEGRRDRAAMAMAAFLAAEPSDLGLPPAMFRLGRAVWLSPPRASRGGAAS